MANGLDSFRLVLIGLVFGMMMLAIVNLCLGLSSEAGAQAARWLAGSINARGWDSAARLLALALAQETNLLLLDEPTTYLDLPHQLEILQLVHTLNRESGRTVAMVFHDINLAARFADRILGMKNGSIEFEGPPSETVTPECMRMLFGLYCVVVPDPVRGTPMVGPS